jgi:myosin-crossreactive antigen
LISINVQAMLSATSEKFLRSFCSSSAQTAVYSLMKIDNKVTPLYKAQYDVGVLFISLTAMFH